MIPAQSDHREPAQPSEEDLGPAGSQQIRPTRVWDAVQPGKQIRRDRDSGIRPTRVWDSAQLAAGLGPAEYGARSSRVWSLRPIRMLGDSVQVSFLPFSFIIIILYQFISYLSLLLT